MPSAHASPVRPATGSLFLRFAGLAGLGWLLDASILLGLVGAGIAPGSANVFSACTAAVTVFLLSRQTLFRKASHHFVLRVAGYVVYTLVVILTASLAIGLLTPWLAGLFQSSFDHARSLVLAAAAAKVLVTPPQLLSNFFVARFVSERTVAAVN